MKHGIDIFDLNSRYTYFPISTKYNIIYHSYSTLILIHIVICRYVVVTKFRNKHDNTNTLHHYKADVFSIATDQQLVELNDQSVQTQRHFVHIRICDMIH